MDRPRPFVGARSALNLFLLSAASILLLGFGIAQPAAAQNRLSITPVALEAPGGVVPTGTSFRYRVSYSCDLVSIPSCDNAVVTIALPNELEFVDRFIPPDVVSGIHDGSPTGGVVTFTFQPSVAAGNTGDLEVEVRFPNGSTPDGTTTTGTVDAVTSTGDALVTQMEDLPPITADAGPLGALDVDLVGGFIGDCPSGSTYEVTLGPNTANGSLDWLDADAALELPAGVTNVSPQDGGVYDAMANTVTWTGLGPISVGSTVTVRVDVSFENPPFNAGDMVTARLTATVDPLGEPPGFIFGPLVFNDTLQQFTENPDATVNKRFGGGRPNSLPPAEGQDFIYRVQIRNTGNIDLDTLVVADDGDGLGAAIDAGLTVDQVTTGAYSPAPTSVTLTLFGDMGSTPSITSPDGATDTALSTAGLLLPGERIDRIEWVFNGGAPVGMGPTSEAQVTATVNTGFPAGTVIDNHSTLDWTATLTGLCGGVAGPASGGDNDNHTFTVADPYTYLRPNKRETTSGDYFPGDMVGMRLDVTNDALANDPATDLVVTDLLPEFLEYVPGSETFTDNGTGVALAAPGDFEVIPNYNGTGRTLLRWNLTGDLDPGETIRIDFDVTVVLGVIFGNLTNTMGATYAAGPVDQICAGASSVDAADLDGDTDTGDTLCIDNEAIAIAAVAQLQSRKFVRGQCDAGFTPGLGTGVTTLGGTIDWRVTVQNVQTVPMQDFVIIDIFPFVGDTGVRDTTLRDTAFRPLLIEPITPPPGGAVFYSTSGNPCRGEVGGPTTGCDAPNWSTVPPTPITDVQSVKIEFGGLVLNPLDELDFGWRMIAPANAPIALDPINPVSGEIAWNSFAFGARRTDDGGFLGAEPNKVGVAVKPPVPANLGDRVWSDDDGDGTQNEPVATAGINNVPVRLFEPGLDGLPGTGDDVLVLSSITSDDASGDPGWYQFSLLPPGTYFVCFQPPPNRPVTAQDVGSDVFDSDVDPATLCTDPVTLGPGDDNQDLDLGLLPPVGASLGNYVWFDDDSNGVQDEALTRGVNGVTVNLYADDGDGNPEPGGDDGTALEVTVTADDSFGNPGFYRFAGLLPGVPYFVEFVLPPTANGFTTRNAGGNDVVDSDARGSDGTSQVVTLLAGEDDPTLDAGLVPRSGTLALGNVVWLDDDGNGVIDAPGDDDGLYDPLLPEVGVNGVRLDLYLDDNGDSIPQADEFFGSTQTQTSAGKAGRYRFDGLPAADYLVVVAESSFAPGEPLEGLVPTSPPVSDPDDDIDSDNEGEPFGPLVVSRAITLSAGGEPTADADDDLGDDASTNFTLDFGFVAGSSIEFDFGDAPDAGTGASQGDYQTTVLDDGAGHPLVGGPAGPYLGGCVDSDSGLAEDDLALADDITGATAVTFGTCVGSDDEDGVGFSTLMLAMGGTVDITVTSSSPTPCRVNGWIDWNRDGVFDPTEVVVPDVPVAGAVPFVGIPVPPTAEPGITYARFRCSTAGGDGPTGMAADGEAEDYRLEILGADFGDAPDMPYGTLSASGGPVHGTDPSVELYLGTCVDTEGDGQPSVGADGDDFGLGGSRIGDCVDDENGVTFDTMLVRGEMAQITVVASMPGLLDAWVDLDGAPGFDAADQILASQPVTPGPNPFVFPVPAAAPLGTTYARFRFSTVGGLAPGGMAPDGEVEDYAVLIKGHDLGDAPDSYGTSLAMGGPRHVVDPLSSLRLGACEDAELDAALPLDASGDDVGVGSGLAGACAVAGDDEDGVVFTSRVITCQTAGVQVISGAAGQLDAWIDFDGDGTFAGVGEKVFDNRAVSAGANNLTFPVPCGAALGATFSRWRLSSTGGLTTGGTVMDGEVEDHPLLVQGVDFGDAPDSYGTSFAVSGPNHGVDPGGAISLGACVDTEADASLPLDATGDDGVGGTSVIGACAVAGDDEDGVTFTTPLIACRSADVTVSATAAGVLDAWIDFDGDGTFAQASDRIFTGQALVAGANALSFAVPCDLLPGATYARFRFSSTGTATANGPAADGEVEDYAVGLLGVDFGDAPDSYSTLFASTGPFHTVDPAVPLVLGSCVDTEDDGQVAGGNANDDDSTVGTSVVGTCTGNDDEAGVSFDTLITACKPATVTVTASTVGVLDAWIDFGGDGSFAEVEDRIATSLALVAGPNTLTLDVPCTATSGVTFSRFRISSAGVLSFDGPADDGEVEDYQISSDEADFGDAPDSYTTLFASGGPLHGLDPARDLYLGACVDSETDGQPTVAADGDDLGAGASSLGTCSGNDDEDGVSFDTAIVACQQADLTIVASDVGVLDAWIDLDGDGTFGGAADRIFASQPLVAGANPLSIQVPCDATPGLTYARFRFSSAGVLSFGGTTPDGEVEDYRIVLLGADLGDAPDTYQTSFATGGPNHAVDSGAPLHLGVCVDTDAEGQPSTGADADDLGAGTSVVGTCVAGDDEDGVVFDTDVNVCLQADLTVTVSSAGFLDAWLDLDGDGTFVGPADQIFTSQPLVAGPNPLSFTVPCDAVPGNSYARFRFGSVGGLPMAGPAADGEVEDYAVLVKGFDFGDAPEPTYPTLFASDGARHIVLTVGNPILGSLVDIETEGLASPDHLGDDQTDLDDEDGVTFTGLYIPNAPAEVTVSTGAVGGVLNAWIDYDQDGNWNEPGEQIAIDLALAAGSQQVLALTIDPGSLVGTTCARFRLSSDSGLLPTGMASDGEVEDYALVITEENALLGLSKVLVDVRRKDPGGSYDLTFLMRLENFGNIRIGQLQVVSNLAVAFAEAGSYSVLMVDSAELMINPGFDGDVDPNLLTGTDALDPGEVAEIQLVINVFPAGNPGPYFCSATATGTSDADTDVMDVSQDGDDPDDNGNGDPTDDGDPTEVLFDLPPIEIPTLGPAGFGALVLLLIGFAVRRLRRE